MEDAVLYMEDAVLYMEDAGMLHETVVGMTRHLADIQMPHEETKAERRGGSNTNDLRITRTVPLKKLLRKAGRTLLELYAWG